jgi:hypothetical protein
LADWVVTVPSITSDPTILDKLFSTAQAAAQSSTVDLTQTLVTKEDMKTLRKKKKAEPEPTQEEAPPKKPVATVPDAGKYLLYALLNFHRTYPPSPGKITHTLSRLRRFSLALPDLLNLQYNLR